MSSVFFPNRKTSVRNLQERYSETPATITSHSKSPKAALGFAARSLGDLNGKIGCAKSGKFQETGMLASYQGEGLLPDSELWLPHPDVAIMKLGKSRSSDLFEV